MRNENQHKPEAFYSTAKELYKENLRENGCILAFLDNKLQTLCGYGDNKDVPCGFLSMNDETLERMTNCPLNPLK